MKIIYLNAWNGELGKNLNEFILQQSKDTDIFCFQEFSEDLKNTTDTILSDYTSFSAYKDLLHDGVSMFEQTMYIKRGLNVASDGTLLENQIDGGLALYVQLEINGKSLYVCNAHGISRPINKLDTTGRLKQSSDLIDFFQDKSGAKMIGGDFNLLPIAESIKTFEKNGYQNLVEKFNIETTRNHFAWDRYPDNKQLFADYIFISKDIVVDKFEVPINEISDHLPLILHFTL